MEPFLRRAGPDDNDAILGFMREQSMKAGLSIRFERGPDFSALLAAHSPVHRTWIAARGSRIVAVASVVVRAAHVDRSIHTVAYLADLRQTGGRDVAGLWRKLAGTVLGQIREEFGAQLLFFSILRDNRLARASILESPLGKTLAIRQLRGYRTVTILGRLPWPAWRTRGLSVRHATPADSEPLRRFIDAQSRELQLAPVFDRETWQHRLETWPDFGIEHFLIAIDGQHRIVGCIAPWDSARINRIVIEALPARVELLRRIANAASFATRRPKIGIGSHAYLPDVRLTHLHVEHRDPQVLAALLRVACREQLRSGRHATLSLCLYDNDPLLPALRGMLCTSTPMDLYCLALDTKAALVEDASLWPGFESYLV